jgi:hypothetical protein
MKLEERLNRQRIQYIVSSYSLDSEDPQQFNVYLNNLLDEYPTALIELALVETLVTNWLSLPLQKGCEFLSQVHCQLQGWQVDTIISTITPEQFYQITGLTPEPIFGPSNDPPVRSISVH